MCWKFESFSFRVLGSILGEGSGGLFVFRIGFFLLYCFSYMFVFLNVYLCKCVIVYVCLFLCFMYCVISGNFEFFCEVGIE